MTSTKSSLNWHLFREDHVLDLLHDWSLGLRDIIRFCVFSMVRVLSLVLLAFRCLKGRSLCRR